MKYQKRNKFWMGIGAPKTSFRITATRFVAVFGLPSPHQLRHE
jgi:hypothetical protein